MRIAGVTARQYQEEMEREIMKKRAFTLVEVMIVVLIIGILISVAVPQFLRTRAISWQKSCMSNLRLLDGAKDEWAIENHVANGAACTMADLVPTYIKANVTCSAGGTYTVGNVGANPTCTIGAPNPHALP